MTSSQRPNLRPTSENLETWRKPKRWWIWRLERLSAVLWNRRSLRADLGLLSVSGSLIQNLLESSKSVQEARESGVGVQMGEDLLHLIDCKPVIETALYA